MVATGQGDASKQQRRADAAKPPRFRKQYVISRPREPWTPEEHERFVEALRLYVRDWKSIEAHIGTKTAIQIRSHAQKYFQKQVKSGNADAVPPPRPKRQSGTGTRAVRKRKTVAWSDDGGSGADSSGEGSADNGSGDEGERREAMRAPKSGASAAAPASSARARQRQQRTTARQPAADKAPVSAAASLRLGTNSSPKGSGVANKRQSGGFASGSGQSSGNLRRPQQGRQPYAQASRSPHPLTSGGSEGAAAVLADWRMNPGSDQDLTRHNVVSGPHVGAVAAVLHDAGAPAAVNNGVPGCSGPSSEAVTMQYHATGVARLEIPTPQTALQATANLGWREHGTLPDYGNGRQLMGLMGLQEPPPARQATNSGGYSGPGPVRETPFPTWSQLCRLPAPHTMPPPHTIPPPHAASAPFLSEGIASAVRGRHIAAGRDTGVNDDVQQGSGLAGSAITGASGVRSAGRRLQSKLKPEAATGVPSGLSAVARAEEQLTLANAFGSSGIGGAFGDNSGGAAGPSSDVPGCAAMGQSQLPAIHGGQWPGAPPGGWTVPSAEPPQQLLQQKSSGGGPVPSPDYFGNALHRDSGGSPHARPRGSEQEVPDSAAIPPDTDFSLMYRFLGGLFDADSSLDHAHVLDKMEPSTRRTAELCMRNLSSNLRMAQAHGTPMLPISPLHLLA